MRLAIALFLLAGCAPAPVAMPTLVSVPVAVSCGAEMVAEPDWNIPQLGPGASVTDKLKAVIADLSLSKGYSEELHAELEACS